MVLNEGVVPINLAVENCLPFSPEESIMLNQMLAEISSSAASGLPDIAVRAMCTVF